MRFKNVFSSIYNSFKNCYTDIIVHETVLGDQKLYSNRMYLKILNIFIVLENIFLKKTVIQVKTRENYFFK